MPYNAFLGRDLRVYPVVGHALGPSFPCETGQAFEDGDERPRTTRLIYP